MKRQELQQSYKAFIEARSIQIILIMERFNVELLRLPLHEAARDNLMMELLASIQMIEIEELAIARDLARANDLTDEINDDEAQETLQDDSREREAIRAEYFSILEENRLSAILQSEEVANQAINDILHREDAATGHLISEQDLNDFLEFMRLQQSDEVQRIIDDFQDLARIFPALVTEFLVIIRQIKIHQEQSLQSLTTAYHAQLDEIMFKAQAANECSSSTGAAHSDQMQEEAISELRNLFIRDTRMVYADARIAREEHLQAQYQQIDTLIHATNTDQLPYAQATEGMLGAIAVEATPTLLIPCDISAATYGTHRNITLASEDNTNGEALSQLTALGRDNLVFSD